MECHGEFFRIEEHRLHQSGVVAVDQLSFRNVFEAAEKFKVRQIPVNVKAGKIQFLTVVFF